jgi:hypothetical protein
MMSDLLFVILTGALFALLGGFLEACTRLGGESATARRASARSLPAPPPAAAPSGRVAQEMVP